MAGKIKTYILVTSGSTDAADVKLRLDVMETNLNSGFAVSDYKPDPSWVDGNGIPIGNPFSQKGVPQTVQSLVDFANAQGLDAWESNFDGILLNP